MIHQFEQDRREVRMKLVASTKVERQFLEEFVKGASVRVTKTVDAENQPVFTFIQEAK